MGKISIIVTHWAMDQKRSDTMRISLTSLFETAGRHEIIIVDNGGSIEDSKWLLEKTEEGLISCYIRNRKNMHFWFARNQGLALASGDYIVIADNDIIYHDGWAEECMDFLKENPRKYLATPIACDPMNSRRKVYYREPVGEWKTHVRAGSNVFMMRRSDFEAIGTFPSSPIAGSKYFDRTTRMGYAIAMMPKPKAYDLGFRDGYRLFDPIKHTEL